MHSCLDAARTRTCNHTAEPVTLERAPARCAGWVVEPQREWPATVRMACVKCRTVRGGGIAKLVTCERAFHACHDGTAKAAQVGTAGGGGSPSRRTIIICRPACVQGGHLWRCGEADRPVMSVDDAEELGSMYGAILTQVADSRGWYDNM